MGLEQRSVKIILIVLVVLMVIGGIIGLVLGLLLSQRYVELEVWPKSDDSYSWDQPLIEFRPSDPGSWNPWVARINDFLRVYETPVPEEPPRAPCSTQRHERRHTTQNCDHAMRQWGPCTIDNLYGYAAGTPCVFLRLNHIHYWVPEPYNFSMAHMSSPPEMPEMLKQQMHQYPAHRFGDFVWVSCAGEFSADQENIGPIQYIPAGLPTGFPTNRLHTADRIPREARNMPDSTPGPLVGVLFENPRRGVVINVECRIWTRDIYYYHGRSARVGRARFELYIE